MQRENALGIDLGTQNSCVGIFLADSGQIDIVPNSFGSQITPSWVGFEEDGRIIVGESAQNCKQTVYDVKRMIGKSYSKVQAEEHINNWDFDLIEKNNRCMISKNGKQPLAVEQITAYVLQALQKAAQKRLGGQEIKKAVITVPANFNSSQRKATKDAATIAGLEVLRIISEPTAAAMAAGYHECTNDRMILVFNFGASCYDLSILDISNGSIAVQATRGDMNLGGRDLDQVLVDHCISEFNKRHKIDL